MPDEEGGSIIYPDGYPKGKRGFPFHTLIETAIKMGLGAEAAKYVYGYMKSRGFEPIQAGVDYETEGQTTYVPAPRYSYDEMGNRIDYKDSTWPRSKENKNIIPERNVIYSRSDAPMPTQTGMEHYDMTERGPEGEILHKLPMTGEGEMTSYNYRTDDPSTLGYVNIGGQIYRRGEEPKGSPAISNMRTETDTAPGVSYQKNDPENVDIINNDDLRYESDDANRRLFEELGFEDINKIEDFETRGKRPKSEVGY